MQTTPGTNVERGTIVHLRDGLARVAGLPGCMAGEELLLPEGQRGWALQLEPDSVVCAVLERGSRMAVGAPVLGAGRLLHVPCGPALLGRVVDPLGRPLDGRGPIETSACWPLHRPGPGFTGVEPPRKPLATGIKILDVLYPLGRGQSRLLRGPRRTGKTTLAVDAMIHQRHSDVLCVYTAIGQRREQVAALVGQLAQAGALAHTTVVATGPDDPPALQLLAPLAGCALAEFFTYTQGRDVLCVHDDLNHLAAACRTLYQLLGGLPGRFGEQPEGLGAIACVLERAAPLATRWVIVPEGTDPALVRDDSGVNRAAGGEPLVYVGPLGKAEAETRDLPRYPGHQLLPVPTSGGSLTALAIAETGEDNGLPFLPGGALAWVDGVVSLDADLFRAGVRPAVDPLQAVRGNRACAIPLLGWLNKQVWLDLLNAAALEDYARLGTELDRPTQKQLDRGRRVRELLNQPPGRPLEPVEQVVSLYAGVGGFLDALPLERVAAFEAGLLDFVRRQHLRVLAALPAVRRVYDREWRDELDAVIAAFQRTFPMG